MPFPLETERLNLRSFQDCDLQVFHTYRSDPLVALYQGWTVPYGLKTARDFVNEMKNTQPGIPGKWFQSAIVLKNTQEMLGDCAFQIMEKDAKQAYIGITIGRQYWRKGYAEEATRRLLDFLFFELRLHRVVAECDIKNVASYSLLERIGFRREAHLVENIWFKGSWESEFHYGLLEREWDRG